MVEPCSLLHRLIGFLSEQGGIIGGSRAGLGFNRPSLLATLWTLSCGSQGQKQGSGNTLGV